MHRIALAAGLLALLTASAAVARPGDDAHPIPLKMARGTDRIVVTGVLSRKFECCAYTFKAHAGQRLYWTETGPAARIGLTYPDGDGINPGLPSPTDLPQDGLYTFSISPDLMADGAFGRFRVTLRIPPAH